MQENFENMNEPTPKSAEELKAEFFKKYVEWYDDYYMNLPEEKRHELDIKPIEEQTQEFLESLSDENYVYAVANLARLVKQPEDNPCVAAASLPRLVEMEKIYNTLKKQADKNGWQIKKDLTHDLMMMGSVSMEGKRIDFKSADKEAFLKALKTANRFDVSGRANGNVSVEFGFNDVEIIPEEDE